MRSTILVLCALLLAVPGAEAVVLGLDPPALVVSPGDGISLDLVASGLGGAVIGDFDVDVEFDPARLTFTGVALTGALGDIGVGEALDFSSGLLAPGLVNLAVVSTLSEAALLALQSDPLTLATLTFDVGAMAPGTSTTLTLFVNALGDGDGVDLPVTALGDSTLRVPGGVGVASPGSLWLLASGSLASGVMRWRGRWRRHRGR